MDELAVPSTSAIFPTFVFQMYNWFTISCTFSKGGSFNITDTIDVVNATNILDKNAAGSSSAVGSSSAAGSSSTVAFENYDDHQHDFEAAISSFRNWPVSFIDPKNLVSCRILLYRKDGCSEMIRMSIGRRPLVKGSYSHTNS